MRQGVVVAQVGHRQFMAQVARPVCEQLLLLPLVQARIKVAGNRELAGGLKEAKAEIRHANFG